MSPLKTSWRGKGIDSLKASIFWVNKCLWTQYCGHSIKSENMFHNYFHTYHNLGCHSKTDCTKYILSAVELYKVWRLYTGDEITQNFEHLVISFLFPNYVIMCYLELVKIVYNIFCNMHSSKIYSIYYIIMIHYQS